MGATSLAVIDWSHAPYTQSWNVQKHSVYKDHNEAYNSTIVKECVVFILHIFLLWWYYTPHCDPTHTSFMHGLHSWENNSSRHTGVDVNDLVIGHVNNTPCGE